MSKGWLDHSVAALPLEFAVELQRRDGGFDLLEAIESGIHVVDAATTAT